MKDKFILNQIPEGTVRCQWSNNKTENVTPADLEQRAKRSRVLRERQEKSKSALVVVDMGRR